MSTDFNFESLHSDQLQPPCGRGAKPKATTPPTPPPTKVITDVAQLENNDPVLTTRVAASLLGIAPETLKKMRQRKQGPDFFATESGAIRYLLSAVLAYRAQRTVKH